MELNPLCVTAPLPTDCKSRMEKGTNRKATYAAPHDFIRPHVQRVLLFAKINLSLRSIKLSATIVNVDVSQATASYTVCGTRNALSMHHGGRCQQLFLNHFLSLYRRSRHTSGRGSRSSVGAYASLGATIGDAGRPQVRHDAGPDEMDSDRRVFSSVLPSDAGSFAARLGLVDPCVPSGGPLASAGHHAPDISSVDRRCDRDDRAHHSRAGVEQGRCKPGRRWAPWTSLLRNSSSKVRDCIHDMPQCETLWGIIFLRDINNA